MYQDMSDQDPVLVGSIRKFHDPTKMSCYICLYYLYTQRLLERKSRGFPRKSTSAANQLKSGYGKSKKKEKKKRKKKKERNLIEALN